MKPRNYLCLEPPDNEATVDFLGPFGVVVTMRIEKNREGNSGLYIVAKGCDDRATTLGEIVADIPKADERN